MFSSTKVAEDNKIESLFPDEEEGGTRKLGSVINKIFHITAYAINFEDYISNQEHLHTSKFFIEKRIHLILNLRNNFVCLLLV